MPGIALTRSRIRLVAALPVLLAACLLSAPAARAEEAAPAPAGALRVMSYNIRYNNRGDGENAWPNRKERVFAQIRRERPDLMGFQEALRGQIDDTAAAFPEYAWCGVGRDDGKDAGEFSPLFYRKARFEAVEHGTFWLSPEPETPGSRGWDAQLPRVASWCRLRDRETGKLLMHFNTHFDHVGRQARPESARLLVARIAAMAGKTPVLLTGDMNSTPESVAYKVFTGATEPREGRPEDALKDARIVSRGGHRGPTGTCAGFRFNGTYGSTIDYVLVKNGVSVLRHAVLDDQLNGVFPSDHLPVLADVVLE